LTEFFRYFYLFLSKVGQSSEASVNLYHTLFVYCVVGSPCMECFQAVGVLFGHYSVATNGGCAIVGLNGPCEFTVGITRTINNDTEAVLKNEQRARRRIKVPYELIRGYLCILQCGGLEHIHYVLNILAAILFIFSCVHVMGNKRRHT
jgi:hypothetical protein